MENRKIFVILDADGLHIYIQFLQSLIDQASQGEASVNKKLPSNQWFSILIPPSYLASDDDDTKWVNGIYEWVVNSDEVKCDVLQLLKEIDNSDSLSLTDCDEQFFSESLHHLADELPPVGSCILEVYVLAGKNRIPAPHLSLISSLKRLELSHQAFFGILCNGDSDRIWEVCSSWIRYIDFRYTSCEEMLMHCKADPIWGGSLNVTFEKYSSELSLQYYFLTSANSGKTLNDILGNNSEIRMSFDSKIEIVAIVSLEDLPLHFKSPDKFFLYSFTPWKQESFNFLNFCVDNTCCLGFLKYDVCAESCKMASTTDWISYVSDDFTHSLSSAPRQLLRKQLAVLIHADKRSESIMMYFFKNSEQINISGFLELFKNKGMVENQVKINDSKHNEIHLKFDENSAHLMQPWEWCEKNSWYLKENLGRIMKSIGRCKSDDFYMQGIMIPSIESVKEGLHQDSFLDFMALFDKNGHPRASDFQAIQVIPDRLLKNIKSEKEVKHLPYYDAVNVIGHGIEYCIDSKGAIRLDQRLLKVQKRLVPQDTMNLTSMKIKMSDDWCNPNKKSQKESIPSKQNSHKKASKRESRADRHKRRLRTIVEGTIIKYGRVSNDHPSYKAFCDKLFEICLSLVKQLKSSKGLNDQMKQFAKNHVNEVVNSLMGDGTIK